MKCFEIQHDLNHNSIWNRVNGYKHWLEQFEKNEGGIDKFAEGYKLFGMNRNADDSGFVFREYLPGAKQVFLIGEFNNWENRTPLRNEGFGRWAVDLPDKANGEFMVPHRTKYKMRIESHDGGWHDRVPAWTKLAWQDGDRLFDAAMWYPPPEERHQFVYPNPPKPAGLKVYESHVGMSSPEPKVSTYKEFADTVLPRIKRLGYNAIQLMAVAEHAYYGCFGYHVTSFFACSSRFGTPEELKYLVDRAHGMGIQVLVDLVHAHASSNAADGIAMLDGTDHCYTHGGLRGYHQQWDSRLFNYESYETLRFLLSNVKWWLTEYRFDGFRFDGVSSMLYHSHAIGKDFHDYWGPDADVAAHIYLMLSNHVIKSTLPSATTIAEDVSGMPTIALPIEWGGFGFDARLAMAIPDMWIKILKEVHSDEAWSMKWIAGELQNRRPNERSIAYAESHDQAIVGDKTVAFWLMDAEMYTEMSLVGKPCATPCIDRGIALHKLIRLVCLSLGEGYLNFCGNEFGHPEWVDFPRAGNGWSYKHAKRRYDLPDMDHLRYKFLNEFDMYMQQVENRFKFLSDWHYNCTMVNDQDKIIVVERGECMIVINFHPCNSYTDYRIGCKWNEPMRTIMDSDEGRFGGHMRLEWGHANSHHVGDGWMGRNHSIKLYMPSRTAQILVPEHHLQGGIRVAIAEEYLEALGEKAQDITLVILEEFLVEGVKKSKVLEKHQFDADGTVHLKEAHEATFVLLAPDGAQLLCASEFDGHYHCYFPGVYVISGIGVVETLSPWEIEDFEKKLSAKHPQQQEKKTHDAQDKEKEKEKERLAKEEAQLKLAKAQASAQEAYQERLAQEQSEKEKPEATKTAKKQEEEGQMAEAQEAQNVYTETSAKEDSGRKNPEVTEPAKKQEEQKQQVGAQEAQEADKKRSDQEHFEKQADEAAQKAQKQEEEQQPEPEMVRCASLASIHWFGPEDVLAEPVSSEPIDQIDDQFEEKDLTELMQSYKYFGLHPDGDSWVFREWLPHAKAAFLIGEFNKWDKNATPLSLEDELEDVWTCKVQGVQAKAMQKGQKYKLYVVTVDGRELYPTPAWATHMVFTHELRIFDALVWPLEAQPALQARAPQTDNERIYECHLGLAARPGTPKSWDEARRVVIPRAARNNYTALLLRGVQESERHSSMGAQPCAYFAPASCMGPPEELQAFVAEAHQAGLRVYMSIAHDGAAGRIDGLGEWFFRSEQSEDPITGARIFNYDHPEVGRFLLSNLAFWISHYGFDGFQFPNVTSMIYTQRGRWLPTDPVALDEHIQKRGVLDEPAIHYLKSATSGLDQLAKLMGKSVTKIAQESSLFSGLCKPLQDSGLGFDFRQSTTASMLFRQLLTKRDEDWMMGDLVEALTQPKVSRQGERVLACAEASEEVVVSKKPLKIAMLAWETLHTIAVGGVAPHVTELSAALHGAGHEVHIFTRAQGGAMDNEIMGVYYHEVNYHTSACMVGDIRNMCSAFVSALHGHESVWGQFDIIHGHDWLAGPAVQELKQHGKRVVFTMHSTEGGRNGDMGKGHPGIKDIERSSCGAADRLICVSGVLRDEVCGCCGADGGRITNIYNGIHAGPIVNMEWHDDWTGNTKADMGWSPMDPMFLFVGRHTAQKGCDILIEAIPSVLQCRGDAKFVIVGDGHLKAANEGRAHALGLGHAVCFTGSLKSGSAHLKALFKACDAVVVPSRNEPFGIVVLEAWAAGKPVVATSSGGPRDFVKPGEDGFLVSPDSGSVAWGCRKILEDFEHAKWMGQNAQAKALREFSWEHIAQQTEQVYYNLLNQEGLPRSRERDVGYSLSTRMLREHCFNMHSNNNDPVVMRGISLLKLIKLLVASAAGDAVMTWMGTEFGQVGDVDMPRPANGFNDECARVKYELADDANLKFHLIEAFEAQLNCMAGKYQWLSFPSLEVLVQCENDKVIAFARGGCVFAFNFHTTKEHKQYTIKVPPRFTTGSLSCILTTDEQKFGGTTAEHGSKGGLVTKGLLQVSLPPRTACVLALDAVRPGPEAGA
eukprot:TRINITY_DN11708_c0_g2_i1.p1 TRINITY_DN11708_c0_g2~~TRINITY_DN11708_c0_g2_i1.p1  ORF type:complete len:2023 (-),score=410.01 TRINITY_DN11708_c0_g2_i1:153-6221(-)